MIRDSLGVPLEPSEPKSIAKDWDGNDINEGDYVYTTPAGYYILEDDLHHWIDEHIGQAKPLHREDL